MTLRCPNCGSKELIFLSTTDGFAVGSTDQRYRCKKCKYQGSFILDDESTGGKNVTEDLKRIQEDFRDEPKKSVLKEGFRADIIVSVSFGVLITIFVLDYFFLDPLFAYLSYTANPILLSIFYLIVQAVSMIALAYIVYKSWSKRK